MNYLIFLDVPAGGFAEYGILGLIVVTMGGVVKLLYNWGKGEMAKQIKLQNEIITEQKATIERQYQDIKTINERLYNFLSSEKSRENGGGNP